MKQVSEMSADEYAQFLLSDPEEAERLSVGVLPNTRTQTPNQVASAPQPALQSLNVFRNGQPESERPARTVWRNGKLVEVAGELRPTGEPNTKFCG